MFAPVAPPLQVLKYNPNALRYDSDNVAGKIIALREAGLPAAVVRSIVRDAPRCLSAAAGTLVERVSILKKAFPSVPAARLVEGAPCLLQKHIAPDAQVPSRLIRGPEREILISRGGWATAQLNGKRVRQ